MFDIDIPWSVVLWMAPVLLPWASIPGALACAFWAFRWRRNVFLALGGLVLGAFALPWAVLLGAFVVDATKQLSALRATALLAALGVVIVTLVLWGVSRAGKRSQ